LELVELVEHRQDPNVVTAKGETPLYFAASRGCRDIVEHLLLSNDCDLDTATSDGRTAIQAALQRGDVATVAILLHRGARIASSDEV
jgi:ankyrin repeat protein